MALNIEELFLKGETSGVFDYFLPGLLIFAVVFGILSATKAFGGNKGVHVIISLVVAALSLRIGYVQAFFTEVFPRTGVAIAVILVLMILTSLFLGDENKGVLNWMMFGVAAAAFIFVILNSFSALNFFGSNWFDVWGEWIIWAIVLIGLVLLIVQPWGKKAEKAHHGGS